MTVVEHFLTKLYHLSNRGLTSIDRYEVGKDLNLSKQETDAIVDELSERERITNIRGINIMLSPSAKKILDSEWSRVE